MAKLFPLHQQKTCFCSFLFLSPVRLGHTVHFTTTCIQTHCNTSCCCKGEVRLGGTEEANEAYQSDHSSVNCTSWIVAMTCQPGFPPFKLPFFWVTSQGQSRTTPPNNSMIPLPWFCGSFQDSRSHLFASCSRHFEAFTTSETWFHILDCARANGSNDTLFRIALIGSNIFRSNLKSKKRSTHGFGWKKHSSIVLPQDLSQSALWRKRSSQVSFGGISCNNETPSPPAAHSFPEASMSNKNRNLQKNSDFTNFNSDVFIPWNVITKIFTYAVYNNDRFCKYMYIYTKNMKIYVWLIHIYT